MTQNFVDHYLQDLGQVLARLDSSVIAKAIQWLRETRDRAGTIYICGNGGSASIASQLVVDIVKGGSLRKKTRIKMIGLTDSVATITAYANDEGYESVFVEPLKNFAQPGDHGTLAARSGGAEGVHGNRPIGSYRHLETGGFKGPPQSALHCQIIFNDQNFFHASVPHSV